MARQDRNKLPDQQAAPSEDGEGPERSVTGAAFWALMDRWAVPDDVALRLIGGPAPTRPGTRPRFRLRGAQVDTYELLRAIDRHLEDLHGTSRAWLSQPQREAPFARRTPLAAMAERGPEAVGEVLRALERDAFKASLRRSVER